MGVRGDDCDRNDLVGVGILPAILLDGELDRSRKGHHGQGFLRTIGDKRKNAALGFLRKGYGKIILPDGLGIHGLVRRLKEVGKGKPRAAAVRFQAVKRFRYDAVDGDLVAVGPIDGAITVGEFAQRGLCRRHGEGDDCLRGFPDKRLTGTTEGKSEDHYAEKSKNPFHVTSPPLFLYIRES